MHYDTCNRSIIQYKTLFHRSHETVKAIKELKNMHLTEYVRYIVALTDRLFLINLDIKEK